MNQLVSSSKIAEIGFVQSTVITVTVDEAEEHHIGSRDGSLRALRMPRYIRALADGPAVGFGPMLAGARRMIKCLNYLHEANWCHMDMKSANIFLDADGTWFLGDFGSATPTGEKVLSTTDAFYWRAIENDFVSPKFDWYMLAVLLCIESCKLLALLLYIESKHRYGTLLFKDARVDNEKIRAHVHNQRLPDVFRDVLAALLDSHDKDLPLCIIHDDNA